MRKFVYKNNSWIIFIILVIISFFLMSVDYHGDLYLKWLEEATLRVFSPLSRGISLITLNIKNSLSSIANFKNLEEENEKLKEEVELILRENALLKEKLRAYERLEKLSELAESFDYEVIPSLVIGREPGNWFNSITIDKGEADGVKKDMAVANNYGLVGRVTSVSANTSKVLLISDQQSAVGGMIQRSREVGVVKGGEGNYCYMEYLPYNADVQVNDVVITSGLGSIFPKGITIGRVVVVEKEKHDLFQKVLIKPEVDFTKLEEVLVIKKSE